MAPTLFRSVARGYRNEPLFLVYDHGSSRYVFRAPELLGCDDLRVLQGVVAIAANARAYIDPSRSSRGALDLRDELALSGIALDEEVLLVETSFASLAAAAGYGEGRGGSMGNHLRAALSRLANTLVACDGRDGAGGWRLIAWDELGHRRDRLRIALNPRLGRCAKAKPRFVQIQMTEARALRGDLARLLHQRLSGWIDLPGRVDSRSERRARFSTLMEYAWGPHRGQAASQAALRQRRGTLKLALEELRRVGWCISVDEQAKEVLEISRPDTGGPRRNAA